MHKDVAIKSNVSAQFMPNNPSPFFEKGFQIPSLF